MSSVKALEFTKEVDGVWLLYFAALNY